MKRKSVLLMTALAMLAQSPLNVYASMTAPDFLPAGQLKLDMYEEYGKAGQDGGNTGEDAEDEAETAQDVLDNDTIGSGTVLISDKTAEDYALAYERAKNANWGYTNLGIADVSDNLNIRASAAEDGRLVGKLPKDAACEVIETDDTWAHIRSGSVDGYVSRDYLLTGVLAKFKAEELATTGATWMTTRSMSPRRMWRSARSLARRLPCRSCSMGREFPMCGWISASMRRNLSGILMCGEERA